MAALAGVLRATEQELSDLTDGQMDSITGEDGVPFLLREAQEKLRLQMLMQRQAAEMQMAILNSLPAHIALLDTQGVILAVNEAWRRFASANVLQSEDFFVGHNYLRSCGRTSSDWKSRRHVSTNPSWWPASVVGRPICPRLR